MHAPVIPSLYAAFFASLVDLVNLVNSPREFPSSTTFHPHQTAPSPRADVHDNNTLLFLSRCQAVYQGFAKAISRNYGTWPKIFALRLAAAPPRLWEPFWPSPPRHHLLKWRPCPSHYGKRHQQVTTLTGRRARHDSFSAVTNN
jgi:hypothetical protein